MSKTPAPKTKNSAPPSPSLVYIPLDQIEPDINQPRRMNTLQRETADRFAEFSVPINPLPTPIPKSIAILSAMETMEETEDLYPIR